MPEAEAAKLLHRLRAAELSGRIQKPVAQHRGSGIFPRLPWSHVCSRGGSIKTVGPNQDAGKMSRSSLCCHSTSAAPASTLFQTKSSAAARCVCVRADRAARARIACTILPDWPARSRDLELRVYYRPPLANKTKIIQYVY